MLKQLTPLLALVLQTSACQLDVDSGSALATWSSLQSEPLPLRGVNLAGAEFSVDENGVGDLPGTFGFNYIYPDARYATGYDSPAVFRQRGVTVFRLQFRWERLQPQRAAAFDPVELDRLANTVQDLLATGAKVILDPHNYARYGTDLIGSNAVPNTDFADFWSRLALRFASEPGVIFGLMNEPHDLPTEQWVAAANAAITEIRAAGATNLVLVPGNDYSGAASWTSNDYGTPNAVALLDIVDSGDNFAFDVHTYLDSNGSGRGEDCVSTTVGSDRLQAVTSWLELHGFRAVLTEFGAGSGAVCSMAIDDLLNHLEQHSDAWLGWTYWSAGPWWGGMYPSIEPDNPAAAAQWAVLSPHLTAAVQPDLAVPAGATLVYDDSLAAGWSDWSWGLNSDVETSDPALGLKAIQLSFGTPGGFKLAHADGGDPRPLAPDDFTYVVLHLNPSAAVTGLQLTLENGSNAVDIDTYATLTPNTWTEVRIPLADLNDQHAPFSVIELVQTGGATLGIDAIWLESVPPAPPPPTPVSYQRTVEPLNVAGTLRSYVLAQPAQPSAAPLPLIIALHGDGGSADGFRNDFPIEQQASGGAVVAYLESVEGSFEYWSVAGRQVEAAFVQALIQNLSASGLIRADRVFLTGLSGGATMTNALGCMLGAGTVRAVGISSGTLYAAGNEFSVAPSGALDCDLPPAVIIWGEQDGAGTIPGQAGFDTKFDPSALGTRDAYRATFGCLATDDHHAVSPDPCVSYDGCDKPVKWCAVPGMGHALWSDAARAIWTFFASQI